MIFTNYRFLTFNNSKFIFLPLLMYTYDLAAQSKVDGYIGKYADHVKNVNYAKYAIYAKMQ